MDKETKLIETKNENKKEKKQKKWIFITIGVIVLILLLLIGNIYLIGNNIYKANKYLGIAFYVLIGILSFLFILEPIFEIMFSPTFIIPRGIENVHKREKLYKKVAKHLIKKGQISSNSINILKENLDKDIEATVLSIYNKDIETKINKIIFKNSSTVFLTTGLSQSSKWDSLFVIKQNLKMIKEIVRVFGYKPSFKRLAKLFVRVFGAALLSGVSQNVVDIVFQGSFKKLILGSTVDGASNLLVTLRIGCVTKKYLFKDASFKTKAELRTEATKEALLILPNIIKENVKSLPEKIKNLFTKKEK